MNNIIIMGRLTADPEIRQSRNGKTISTFTVAVDRRQKEKQTDFFRCLAYDRTADNIERYFSKGNMILIRGSMYSEQYEKDGRKMKSWTLMVNEFDFVESRTKTESNQEADPAAFDDVAADDFPF